MGACDVSLAGITGNFGRSTLSNRLILKAVLWMVRTELRRAT